jgi:hypothetical protein
MPNEFLETLRSTSQPGANDGVLGVLDEFCQGVEAFTGGGAACQRRSGFVTNLGQEWRIVVRSAAGGPEQVLLRAHVPLQGYPVKLDLYEEQLVDCPGEAELRAGLRRALSIPGIKDTIAYFKR